MIRKAILFFNRDPESDSDEDDWGWGCTLRECIESPRGSAPCAHRQAGGGGEICHRRHEDPQNRGGGRAPRRL